jgi:hypothetical protein
MKQQDAKTEYADIIALPHRQSPTRPHMSLYDRAAQFAPFAALSGYDEMIVEEARLTDRELSLCEEETEALNRRMAFLLDELAAGRRPRVTLTHFIPDTRKAGGRYVTTSGRLKKIDLNTRTVVLYGSDEIDDRTIPAIIIPLDRIVSVGIEGEPVPDGEDAR